MMTEVLIALGVFAAFVLIVGQVTRLMSDISLNRTMREALRSHPDSVALLAEKLGVRQPAADGLLGWLFIALAVGLVLVALFEPFDERRDMFQLAIVPLVVGVTALAYVSWAKRGGA